MSHRIITIEREYASGGREIGEMIAERLGIPCYNREILQKAAMFPWIIWKPQRKLPPRVFCTL